MSDKINVELVAHVYERLLDSMQGKTFYVEDDEGMLRRWYAPRPRFKGQWRDEE